MFPGSARFARERKMQNAKCRNHRVLRRFLFAFCILLFAFLLTACRQKMSNQPRYDPLEPSDFFADGMSARPRIAGTVARGELSTDPFLETGKIGAADGDGFPMPVNADLLDRGEQRFNIYCTPCHG